MLGGGTVYRSDDAGQTWAAVGRAPEISATIYTKAAELGPDGRLYVGLHEIGVPRAWVYRTAERLTVAAEPGPVPSSEGGLGVEVSPNPFRDTAEVTLTLAEPAEVTAAVYDVLGRRVALLHEGALSSGSHPFTLDGAALPAGVYVVRAVVGKEPGSGTRVLTRAVTLMQ
jgi:hypothetical protein